MSEATSNTAESVEAQAAGAASTQAAGTPVNPNPAPEGQSPVRDDQTAPAAAATLPPPPPSPTRSGSWKRNQVPGILDRRKTTRQPDRSRSRSSKGGLAAKRGGPPIRVTMADIGAEIRAKDGETPSAESDIFEDAPDATPKPMSPEPAVTNRASTGLAIDGAEEKPQSIVQPNGKDQPKISARQSQSGGDDTMKYTEPEASHSRQPTLGGTPELDAPAPALQERERSISPNKQIHGLSGNFVVGTPPPPSTADRVRALEQRPSRDQSSLASPQPQAEGLARKASSGFAGLLGRMGSIRKIARSPPAPRQESRFAAERKNITTSMASSIDGTLNGLAPIVDEPEKSTARPSLRDQFRDLRRQEERTANGANGHAINGDAERTPIARTRSDAGILESAAEANDDLQPPRLDRSSSTPGLLKSPPLTPGLPPGTASGMSAGPADEPRPVNWDLWQTVFYEGPTAVKRTSGEELQAAIASGIPAAIRGVVWQVLTDSKNEELEAVYRTLKARGTEAEQQQQFKPTPMSRSESQNAMINGATLDKDSISSSRSSVHSDMSTPATSAMASPPPSVDVNPMDVHAKLLAEKQKRETAALTKLEKCIKRDMGSRTSFSKYTQSAGLQGGLFGVCKAYALFDEGVGYAQGINFIAMPLLFNMSEEEAFTLLVKLMSKYDLRSMFTPDMAGLHLRLYQFERLLEDMEPTLYCHLRKRKVDPQLYATQWFLTLFAYRFPLQLVLRVYDLILTEGLTAILKFGIVHMQQNREVLLAMKDMSQLCAFLKEKIFDVYIDKSPSASSLLDSGFFGSVTGGADRELYRADEMVRDACEVDISESQLAQYTSEWEDQQRESRSRTEELEALRSSNTLLTSRLKVLEERTQQQDTEHVSFAGELVRRKVELDNVLDENEGLKMKMEELQKLVEAQPAEVEARLKEEMERIMMRNIEVQNENRSLKEEQEDMERELVEAKMACAQAQADRDEVQQRFASVQALING